MMINKTDGILELASAVVFLGILYMWHSIGVASVFDLIVYTLATFLLFVAVVIAPLWLLKKTLVQENTYIRWGIGALVVLGIFLLL